jgi:hypothetical protein
MGGGDGGAGAGASAALVAAACWAGAGLAGGRAGAAGVGEAKDVANGLLAGGVRWTDGGVGLLDSEPVGVVLGRGGYSASVFSKPTPEPLGLFCLSVGPSPCRRMDLRGVVGAAVGGGWS